MIGFSKKNNILIVLFFWLFTSFYCSGPSSTDKDTGTHEPQRKPEIRNLSIDKPQSDDSFIIGEEVKIQLKLDNKSIIPDSVQLVARNQPVETLHNGIFETTWKANLDRVGRASFRAIAFYGDTVTETRSVNLTLLSDLNPGNVRYTIVNEYKHDPEAFTQGLVYDNGYFFESTGHYGKSTVRKVEVETGNVIQVHQLGKDFFGEGLAIFNSKLFQLTWKEQVGFIFDKESFTMLQKIYYDIKEGWGLTFDGKKFIMSDGTARLYFIDPKYFTESGQIEVYDNKGMVTHLNELEYINGKVYANIWGKEIIAIIDPNTGKVTHYLDFSKHIPENSNNDGDKVMNGIAYNSENGHLYVTGKHWPVLYEIDYSLE